MDDLSEWTAPEPPRPRWLDIALLLREMALGAALAIGDLIRGRR